MLFVSKDCEIKFKILYLEVIMDKAVYLAVMFIAFMMVMLGARIELYRAQLKILIDQHRAIFMKEVRNKKEKKKKNSYVKEIEKAEEMYEDDDSITSLLKLLSNYQKIELEFYYNMLGHYPEPELQGVAK